ncbi:putative nicotinamide mononucleotide transporter [Capsulimonas corticalis]|uniref:Nicotinamide mononucleotide transporter n=1 Tax=Capsulimonas corticalis TaxID=2219043 RepID=A0A402CQG1_9BACT|nr:nicotinamide riboside transporter PnuC [Capsulimonas corticalis]BDI32623.1 putative nicotinamide mononucleotide transporter [Capsulimonas corticalis]
MQRFCYGGAAILSIALLVGAARHTLPLEPAEAWGFVTGALCVWLTVKQNIWNWPIGIVNNFFFIALFWHSRLFADMTLQIIYVVLGVMGWYWWLHGGRNRSPIQISNTPRGIAIVTSAVVLAATAGMTVFLRGVHDSAPFLDAVTTTLSLAAQFLLTKKMLENWYLWIFADVLYIGLYTYKHLYLTAVLYLLFLIMCCVGLRDWKRSMENPREDALPTDPAGSYV